MDIKRLKSIIDELSYNDDVSLPDLVAKGDTVLNDEWESCNRPSVGREFYYSVVKGHFDTKDFHFIPIMDKKNPQCYKKEPVDKPILLDESVIDMNASVSDALKLLKLMSKTLAIVSIDKIIPANQPKEG
jgi:hypothetical protein